MPGSPTNPDRRRAGAESEVAVAVAMGALLGFVFESWLLGAAVAVALGTALVEDRRRRRRNRRPDA
ncbi:MAG: hypothetical protein AB7O97_06855 [Planctomycetota bacterium]